MYGIPNILTIAGSDSGGGAGVQADLKSIMALGGYGMTVITALTAQNGMEVAGIEAVSPEFVLLQYKTVAAGFTINAAKTGMLYSAEIIKIIVPELKKRDFPLIVDPVSISQSGNKLLQDDAIAALKTELIPICDLLTPNIPEAQMLADMDIDSPESALEASEKIAKLGARAVLIKGGHMHNDIMVTDYLFIPGQEPKLLRQPKVDTNNNHGTGCTLSAAIACELGKGVPLEIAVSRAQRYLNAALRKSYAPGKGCGPVNHAVNI